VTMTETATATTDTGDVPLERLVRPGFWGLSLSTTAGRVGGRGVVVRRRIGCRGSVASRCTRRERRCVWLVALRSYRW